jgi:hypothetical protein
MNNLKGLELLNDFTAKKMPVLLFDFYISFQAVRSETCQDCKKLPLLIRKFVPHLGKGLHTIRDIFLIISSWFGFVFVCRLVTN